MKKDKIVKIYEVTASLTGNGLKIGTYHFEAKETERLYMWPGASLKKGYLGRIKSFYQNTVPTSNLEYYTHCLEGDVDKYKGLIKKAIHKRMELIIECVEELKKGLENG